MENAGQCNEKAHHNGNGHADWRPGLGKVFQHWKPYFVCKTNKFYDMEGMFDGQCIHGDPKPAARVAALGGQALRGPWTLRLLRGLFQ
ncbi:MAG: hypothetical protein ABIF71_08730 [Planctomycetota bacterium]